MTKPLTNLQSQWLCEAVRLREEQTGLLDDNQACRDAIQQAPDLLTRLRLRALALAERDGLTSALKHWLQGAKLATWLMLMFAILTGVGLAKAALVDTNQVNILWALGCLLALHFVSLLLWSIGFFASGDASDSLGRLWLWLSGKLARDVKSAQLAPALLVLLQRNHILRWAVGRLIHAWWLVALISSLITLLLLLSTKRYGFIWESTIVASNSFVSLVEIIGYLPHLIGFSQPSAELIQHSGESVQLEELARATWANWLVGMLFFYGVVPRLVLWLLCHWRYARKVKQIQLDINLPVWLELSRRLMPSSERMGVVDQAPRYLVRNASGNSQQHTGYQSVLASIELDPIRQWSIQLSHTHNAGALDSREQRNQLLDQLSAQPAQRLLIICDPLRSVDRSTLNLLAELSHYAKQTRVCLLPAPPNQTLDADRLYDWHKSLDKLGIRYSAEMPLAWLEHGNEV